MALARWEQAKQPVPPESQRRREAFSDERRSERRCFAAMFALDRDDVSYTYTYMYAKTMS
jgi:hypothetical protein